MRILIRHLRRRGSESEYVDRLVEADVLNIGRGTDQHLEIADMRVGLAHARLSHDGSGFRIEARSANGIWLNDGPVGAAALQAGDTLQLGRFDVRVLKGQAGAELVLVVEERESQAAERERQHKTYRDSLAKTGLSRRSLSWLAFVLVLLPMLGIPLYLRYEAPTQAPQLATLSWPTDHLWNSGPVSAAHQYFQKDCAQCHEEPFVQVRNQACLSCHSDLHSHVHQPQHLNDVSFAQAQCTDCHREHNGDSIVLSKASLCTGCHAMPQHFRNDMTMLKPVTDFSMNHPEFAPRVARFQADSQSFIYERLRQGGTEPLREDTNLVYPHDVHLAAAGVDAPEGKRVLQCKSCHVADASGIGFEPVKMETHCADCHRLEFDPDDPQRVLPHGQPAEVAGVIRDYYAHKALAGGVTSAAAPAVVQSRRRPGETLAPASAKAALAWADRQATIVIDEVFDQRTCRYCHEVSRSDDPAQPWRIAPVGLEEHALAGARFDHGPHETQPCANCHAAGSSKQSGDVLLPAIGQCRDCHGDMPGVSKIPTDCIDCHSFHDHDMPMWPGAEAAQANAKLRGKMP